MTEADWLRSKDSYRMLRPFHGMGLERKKYLFWIACCLRNEKRDDPWCRSLYLRALEYADRQDDLSLISDWPTRQRPSFETAEERAESINFPVLAGEPTQEEKAILIRDIFGNPFRPVTLDPAWRTANAVALAQAIYDERAFERMPILGDALEDAGCDNDDILNHCREPGEHVRGCWVVDLLLGKS
jgi:hypothetical protein